MITITEFALQLQGRIMSNKLEEASQTTEMHTRLIIEGKYLEGKVLWLLLTKGYQ